MDSGYRATLRRSHAALAAVLLSLPIAFCSEKSAEANQGAPKGVTVFAPTLARQSAVVQRPESKEAGAARDQVAKKIAQSDDLFLEMADRACRSEDFKSFFRAFSGSRAVRERHMARNLTIGIVGRSRAVTGREYLSEIAFPISPMDNDYVTVASAEKFERLENGNWRDLLYVRLDFEFAQDSRVRVEWTPGTFERHLDFPPLEPEEGLGRMIRQMGEGGVLLFAPNATCWELFADITQSVGKHLDK